GGQEDIREEWGATERVASPERNLAVGLVVAGRVEAGPVTPSLGTVAPPTAMLCWFRCAAALAAVGGATSRLEVAVAVAVAAPYESKAPCPSPLQVRFWRTAVMA